MKNERLESALRFYLLATQLKHKIRAGWDEKHWNISAERLESVAEHVYGACILALSISSEFETDVEIDKVIKMLILHELGEVIIGDITPFDGISQEEKRRIEHEVMEQIIGDLIKKDEYLALLNEFDDRETKEAKFAYHCDKLEADMQTKIYQDMGYQRPISGENRNSVFQNARIQQSIQGGAQNVFDIWYEWDKEKFRDDENFMALLDYLREVNTQDLINKELLS